MPSQSALELRSEYRCARARGGHDRDEVVTFLWQRTCEGQTIRGVIGAEHHRPRSGLRLQDADGRVEGGEQLILDRHLATGEGRTKEDFPALV